MGLDRRGLPTALRGPIAPEDVVGHRPAEHQAVRRRLVHRGGGEPHDRVAEAAGEAPRAERPSGATAAEQTDGAHSRQAEDGPPVVEDPARPGGSSAAAWH